MANLAASGVWADCGAECSRAGCGHPRRRCERGNRWHQNARDCAVPPGVKFSCWKAASLRGALATEQGRLTAWLDARSLSGRDIAWLTGCLALGKARTAAAAPPPEPRDPADWHRGPAYLPTRMLTFPWK